jgi:uncharacterized BrkB/YihY/UPF0761 family membrane protein
VFILIAITFASLVLLVSNIILRKTHKNDSDILRIKRRNLKLYFSVVGFLVVIVLLVYILFLPHLP